ncbi:DUF1707 SHOCT-like domain-containing protein [Actinomadura fibrosa]|uniref:DUF1707 domain-containing protein n=1 Tax=Actinomadura fibrosa TaxID=111802 RepID=A0ABW2XX28_9ACTN|nr:DUF1707 domain-containing protein [Actinomadura fibrosa]
MIPRPTYRPQNGDLHTDGADDLRIGDAERDAVMVALHDHFAAGRLDRAELDERLGTVLTAKTRRDLRAVVRDLPGDSGLPEPSPAGPAPGRAAFGHAAFGRAPWEPGAAVMFAGPGHPHFGRHHHRMARARGHRHGPPFPAFPLLLGVFVVLAFTVGPGTGFLAVLQIALVIWLVRAILLAFNTRRTRSRQ